MNFRFDGHNIKIGERVRITNTDWFKSKLESLGRKIKFYAYIAKDCKGVLVGVDHNKMTGVVAMSCDDGCSYIVPFAYIAPEDYFSNLKGSVKKCDLTNSYPKFETYTITADSLSNTVAKSITIDPLHQFSKTAISLDDVTDEEMYKPLRIIYNNPATVVFWRDGTKTIVKKSKNEKFNAYNAFCAALAKKVLGNNSRVRAIVASGDNQAYKNIKKKIKKIQKQNEAKGK